MLGQRARQIRERETVATFYSSLGKQNVYLLKPLDLPIHLFLESTLVLPHLGIFDWIVLFMNPVRWFPNTYWSKASKKGRPIKSRFLEKPGQCSRVVVG